MKIIRYINTFAISLPIVLTALGIIINDSAGNYFGYALFSTMLTGFLQVLLGVVLYIRNPKNRKIILYLWTVVLYFTLWYLNATLFNSKNLALCLFVMPPILAAYLSVIIYKKEQL